MFFATDKSSPNKFRGHPYLIAAVLSVLWACAPGPRPTELPKTPEITWALERFEKAEHLFQEQDYSKALAIYKGYLRLFPKGPLVDTALMKTGLVHMAVENYPQARRTFHRLTREYRKSSYAEDARFNLILAYYKEGNYTSAIKYAGSALRRAKTSRQKFRIYNVMGYIYSADKEFKNGIKSYMKACQRAKPQERTEILSKVKEIITYLKKSELNSLIKVYRNRVPGGYLRLQLAKERALEDRIEPAIKILSDFISLFPHHDEIETAMALMEELKSRLLVDRLSMGCILPLSGPYRAFGNRALMGVELALSQFNSQPDVNPIQLVIKDSKGDHNEAARAVESLALTHKVIGLIGPMITSESAAIKAQDLKVPIMTLTQKPDITKLGDYVFRNFLTPSLQVRAIVAYATQELGIKKFAVIYPEERYGISFMNKFWDELLLHGAEVVGIESYGLDQTDFADVIKKLAGLYYPRPEKEEASPEYMEFISEFLAAEHEDEGLYFLDTQEDKTPLLGPLDPLSLPDEITSPADQQPEQKEKGPEPIVDFGAVFIPDTFEKIGMIAPQFPYYDVTNVYLLGTNLWHSDKLIQTSRKYVQDAIVPDGFFLGSPLLIAQDFAKSFKDVFGISPGFLEAQAYDTASILFQLANRSGVRSRLTLKTALMDVKDFPGVTGLTSFDETGDVDKQIYLLNIVGRRFVQIRP